MLLNSVEQRVAERKRRWVEFCRNEQMPGFLYIVNCPERGEGVMPKPHLWPSLKEERIEYAWQSYQAQLRSVEWLGDDSVPFLDNLTGTEIFAEAFGCPVERSEHTNPFAMACVHTAEEAGSIQVPELSSSSLAYLFDIADELHRRGGPDAAMRLVDIQSPMDIAALVWDKSSLFMAMLDTPEAVKELARKCGVLLRDFMDEWFSRYGNEYVAHYPEYFMSGGITLSEDEIGAVSEDMFNEFFRDELIKLSEHFGGLGIHCCADAGHHWANIQALPGLRVLNFNCPPTRPETYVTDAYAFFAAGPVQMHNGWTPSGPVETWPKQFPENARVIIQVNATDREEAIDACRTLRQLQEKAL